MELRCRLLRSLIIAAGIDIGAAPLCVQAQDFDGYESDVSFSEEPAYEMMSANSGGANEWNAWYGSKTISCNGRISSNGRAVSVWLRLRVTANGATVKQIYATGWKVVQKTLTFDPLNYSPATIQCELETVNGWKSIESRSSGFRGIYARAFWDYDAIIYEPTGGCSHQGMDPNGVIMVNPAPDWPNVNDPPPFVHDEGFWFRQITSPSTITPYGMHFYFPTGSLGPCSPPM
jgi:hypothetical protein